MRVLVTLTLLVSVSSGAQVSPGPNSRPILSDQEAALFTKTHYFQGWTPPNISTIKADYTVGAGGYSTIQAAVNDALKAGGSTRKYIKITPGIYNQIVYIATTNVPLTLYGDDSDPKPTIISFDLPATINGSDYAGRVGAFFKPGDPAYKMYSKCANSSIIGTICTCVVWVKAPNIQIVNLTIENVSNRTGTNQAVALYTQEGNFQVSNSRLLGHQDTFWAGTNAYNITARGHVTDTYIQGDVDFVIGGGSVVFERCIFYAVSGRNNHSVIFAPGTAAAHSYGFLVIDSGISGDSSFLDSKKAHLARAWDVGLTSLKDYVAGNSTNGQLVVRESCIDAIFPVDAPYTKATSDRPYCGNVNGTRDFNDPHFNRFWEYGNTGAGA